MTGRLGTEWGGVGGGGRRRRRRKRGAGEGWRDVDPQLDKLTAYLSLLDVVQEKRNPKTQTFSETESVLLYVLAGVSEWYVHRSL